MRTSTAIFFFVLAGAMIVLSMSVFTVDETEQAIVLQLGQPKGDVKGPGLHFKIPVAQEVRRFDRRIMSVDPEPVQMVVSSSLVGNRQRAAENKKDGITEAVAPESIDDVSGEPIMIDTFARYKIVDPIDFMKTLRTTAEASDKIERIMEDATRSVLGNTTLGELLSPERTSVMYDILTRVNSKTVEDNLGLEIVDIRIVRADLTPALRQSTVRRMISELRERATETRAKGEERALEIRSRAEKEKSILLAEAQRDAEIIKGEGDGTAIKTYTDAFNKDGEFYGFMRSLEAYRNTLADQDTQLILSPDSQFFKHFKGKAKSR